ncbi:MAG: ribulose-phosphate 3-epimerase [Candidatus Berkelbacteria bacterium]|nr:ribulose-phosphate 3-epimerase [Candidatus Berkelbacteria bacterium]
MKAMVSASIMCANVLNLGEEVRNLEKAGVDCIHIDVMDGNFVPNFVTGCPDLIRALKSATNLPLDVHLMIQKPENHVEAFANAGADIIVFHYEATDDPSRVVAQIIKLGVRPGIAIKPETPVSKLEPFIKKLDFVLIMTVNPGFAGQGFIPATIQKITDFSSMVRGRELDIEVDGGLTIERITDCCEVGTNVYVGGTSSIFEKQTKNNSRLKPDIEETITKIQHITLGRGPKRTFFLDS